MEPRCGALIFGDFVNRHFLVKQRLINWDVGSAAGWLPLSLHTYLTHSMYVEAIQQSFPAPGTRGFDDDIGIHVNDLLFNFRSHALEPDVHFDTVSGTGFTEGFQGQIENF